MRFVIRFIDLISFICFNQLNQLNQYNKKKESSPHSGPVAFHRRIDAMPNKFDSDKKLKRNVKNNVN
jgi:hypothetical protein